MATEEIVKRAERSIGTGDRVAYNRWHVPKEKGEKVKRIIKDLDFSNILDDKIKYLNG